MKGVVLSGGTGSRLRPITYSMAKQLVPVGNKPILFYGLEDLAQAGIREVGIIISPETGDEVRAAVGDGSQLGIEASFIVQEKPLGLAHALKTALPFVDGDDVLMYLGDNLVKDGVAEIAADFRRDRPNCQILLKPVDNPSAFGVAELDAAGQVVRLIEKPADPPSNLALVGAYLFDQTIAEAVDAIEPSARGELEITDAIQYLVTSDRDVRASIVREWWKDTGKKDDLLHANELVLSDLQGRVEGELVDCTVRGEIIVGAGARLVDCTLTGPAVIGARAHLTRVDIGQNTAIGDGCRISDSTIEDSIILAGAEIHGWRLRNSLLGRECRLHGSAPSRFVELTLGERSEILGE
jgi:glucose-1-phosphate thymidylyltransferase